MTKHLARYLAALAFLVFLPGLAWAQSSPGLYNGQVPTAAQWNQYFQKKADWPIGGFCADGSIYANFTGVTNSLRCTPYTGVPAASAAKWTTARTLTVTGDLSLTIAGIDGSANFTGAATLPTVNGNVGSFTCTNFTVNAKGLITAASSGSCAVGTVTTTGSPSSGQMAKFSGATSITTAVSGTDYAPATSGSAILKGNGAGGFSAAVANTDYQSPVSAGPGIGITSNVISDLIAAGGVQPGGRLSLTSGQYIMTSDVTNTSTVYYLCGRKIVPYYDGSNDQADTISGCQVSLTMATSGTGVTNSGGVFDVYWVHSGANRICVVTNGSGGGWASDTGGSNTARGTGYSQVHNTRGYWTNTNAITHCYNGTTDYGSVNADQGTYLGSLYTTGAGQTGFQQGPVGGSGGGAPCMCLYNAANRVLSWTINQDTKTGSPAYTYTSTTWRSQDNSTANRASFLDGLQQSPVQGRTLSYSTGVGFVGLSLDGTSTPTNTACLANVATETSCATGIKPQIGFHFLQQVEATDSSMATYYLVQGSPAAQLASLFVGLDN